MGRILCKKIMGVQGYFRKEVEALYAKPNERVEAVTNIL